MAVLRIVMALVMTLARVVPFLIVAVLLFLLWRRSARKKEGPQFKGPVVTVDYEEVKDESGEEDL